MSALGYTGVAAGDSADCLGLFDYTTSIAVVIASCVLGLAWAVYNFMLVRAVNVKDGGDSEGQLVEGISEEQRNLLIELGDKISNVLRFPPRAQSSS